MTILGSDPDGNTIEITQTQRYSSCYVIGKTGVGKSTLIENMLIQDIAMGISCCLIEPHHDLTENVIKRCDSERINRNDVILLNPLDEKAFGLNIYECPDVSDPVMVARTLNSVMDTFEKLYDMSRATPQMAQVMRNLTLLLIHNPGMTILEIPRILADKQFRAQMYANLPSRYQSFWKRYETLSPHEQEELTKSSINKIDEFINDPIGFYIYGQSHTSINFREIMDRNKVVLISLSTNFPLLTSLLGSILISQILMASLSRENIPQKDRSPFNLYIDEFQNFATPSMNQLLTESRKYHVSSTIGHQTRKQLPESLQSTTQNVGSLICFQLTSEDAEELASEFNLTPRPGDPIERPVRTYKQEVVKHLLEKGHTNKDANGIVDELLRPMQDLINRMDKETYRVTTAGRMTKDADLYDDEYSYYTFRSHLITGLAHIDRILVEAMTGKNPPCSEGFKSMTVEAMMTLRGYLEIQGGLLDERTEELPLRTSLHELLTRMTHYECSNYERDILADPPVYRAIKAWNIEELRRILSKDGKKKYSSEEIENSLKFRSNAETGSISGFLWYLYLLSKKLAEEPIMVDSGKYEQVEGPRQSYSDRANEVANELVHMKRGHARIKIPGGEYLMTTILPKSNHADLQPKKDRIIEYTRKKYCKSRANVEEEIRRRQGVEEPPPSITRKHPV